MTKPTHAAKPIQGKITVDAALRTFDFYKQGIMALSEAINSDLGKAIVAATSLIHNSQGRVIVSGMGKSGHVGRKIAATLASTGSPAYFVHPSEASHGDLGMIMSQDVLLVLSWSGETAELSNLIAYSRRFQVGLIAISSDINSTLARAADINLILPKVPEACPNNLAPTTSSLLQLAIGDALAITLLESRGFTPNEFQVFHPGGKLGALLTFVHDLMHGIDETPLVKHGTSMSSAIVEMSSKGFGCVGIVGDNGSLIGIITDGDLRRHMRPGLFDAVVDDIMTRAPKTIGSEHLAAEALKTINTSKVQSLFVVEQHKPIGIIRMHDILRAGLA
jgi:arabinose-5-phosphate isomerase